MSKWENYRCERCERTVPVEDVEGGVCDACRASTVTPKIKYWWSEDRQWFCLLVSDGAHQVTVSLNHDEASALADEAIMTPKWMALLERSWGNVASLLDARRKQATDA